MLLTKKSVELLAPAGTWAALEAAVEAGADAVYLGGKCFNMRLHRSDTNFTEEELERAVAYAHAHGVRLYVTLNNLISSEELPKLKEYLRFLDRIKVDAILVQDLAVLQLAKELSLGVSIHASVMMNTHNEKTIELLKEYGVTRIVVGRELTLEAIALLKERTGVELEYFIHGDMCMSESGQCIHSGVLFGQSSSRGRCLKPCRWAFRLLDEESGESLETTEAWTYKLALKDMCMYRNIPELIQAGVTSFKIEGRMRPPDFVRRIVATYRAAIDRYIADPVGYHVDKESWRSLYENRVRDYTTTFAFGQTTAADIGFGGEREPRFFSDPVKEATLADDAVLLQERPMAGANDEKRRLSVRVQTKAQAVAAIDNGADTVYIGGEAYLPNVPLTIEECREIIAYAHERGKRAVLNTPRTTMRRECGELEQLFSAAGDLGADGIMVSNLGALRLAGELTSLPVQADFSFNLFNEEAAKFLRDNGAVMATAAYEMSFAQVRRVVEAAVLPIEVTVHGAYETMICDHNIPAMTMGGFNPLVNPEILERHYALLDKAGEKHAIRIDQYGRNHLHFARDLCYYPYLDRLNGVASYRIEAQDYAPELVAALVTAYRQGLDTPSQSRAEAMETVGRLESLSPRPFGIGAWRFRESKNSF